MPSNTIAVNLASYQRFAEGAFAHLESIGVRHVEIAVPAPDAVEDTRRRLDRHGLSATSLMCPCELTEDPETMRPHLEVGRALNVSLFFVSVKAGDALSKPEAYRRLRGRADLAAEYGITLSLETHPDLCENAGEARATLVGAGRHPRLGWNLDTANLYYYNHNIDAVEQARQGADLITSVHLKETNGAYHAWWFPALGEGVVDFAAVFGALGERGFHGPYTLEIEGVEGETLDEAATQDRVARSIEHLRRLGVA